MSTVFRNSRTSQNLHLNRLTDILALRDGSAEVQGCSSCEEHDTITVLFAGALFVQLVLRLTSASRPQEVTAMF